MISVRQLKKSAMTLTAQGIMESIDLVKSKSIRAPTLSAKKDDVAMVITQTR